MGILAGMAAETPGTETETARVREPRLRPLAESARALQVPAKAAARPTTAESLVQVLASETVRPVRDTRGLPWKAFCVPNTVTLTEPVAGILVGVREFGLVASTDRAAVRVATLRTTVALSIRYDADPEKRVGVRGDFATRAVWADQTVNSEEDLPSTRVLTEALQPEPSPAPRTVTLLAPVAGVLHGSEAERRGKSVVKARVSVLDTRLETAVTKIPKVVGSVPEALENLQRTLVSETQAIAAAVELPSSATGEDVETADMREEPKTVTVTDALGGEFVLEDSMASLS